MPQIFAFGDSITWGSWDTEGGWADRLKREIIKYIEKSSEDKEIVLYNLGIPSNRTDQLLERFQNEADQRYDKDNQDQYFIFSFGANDAAYQITEKKFRLDVEEYKNNIKMIIDLARKYSSHITFLNITPVDERKTDGVLNKAKSRKNEYVDKYNKELKEVCREKKVDLIDVNSEFKKTEFIALLCDDGLHPNTEGHKVILNLVKGYFIDKQVL